MIDLLAYAMFSNNVCRGKSKSVECFCIRSDMSSESSLTRDPQTDARLIQESGFFDEKWYCDQYPDVKQISIDPAMHFLKYGWRLMRNPCQKFHIRSYLERYPEVKSSGSNPLLHFLQIGKEVGHTAPPVPAQEYQSPDLKDVPLTIAQGLVNEAMRQGSKADGNVPTAEEQLVETQRLLEHYFEQYETLRFAMLDKNNNTQSPNPAS